MNWSDIKQNVIVGVVTAVVLGALVLLWNWASAGGLVKALGGITRADAELLAAGNVPKIVAEVKSALSVGNEIIPAPGGNGQSQNCPEGSVMVGALWKIDPGGPHGIISWVSPVCRTLGR